MKRWILVAATAALGSGAWAQDLPACVPSQTGVNEQECSCAPGHHEGQVWGSGPYTLDSDICTAAIHAGVLGPDGGRVVVEGVESPNSFAGTVSNGITTVDWGIYAGSFIFPEAQAGIGLPACGALGPDKVTACACPAGSRASSVWGSGPYTDDSDICTAAQHAGVIGLDGGPVTVKRVVGQASYEGSTQNGVATHDFGSWAGSFDFASEP